jgi:carbon monoxide dehydrogenase subunit G
VSLVATETSIAAPPQAVWDVVMNPARLGEWVTIHRGVRDVSSGRPHVGFEMTQTLHLRGVNFHVRWELAECDPPRRALWEGRGPARSKAHIEYLLNSDNGGTRFQYRNEFKPPLGPLGAAASRALVGGISEREAEHSLERLKAVVEDG